MYTDTLGRFRTNDTVTFACTQLHFHPDPIQAQVLDPNIRRGILNCCRQWGKSTTLAVKAVHHAFTHPKSLTVCISPLRTPVHRLHRLVPRFLPHPSVTHPRRVRTSSVHPYGVLGRPWPPSSTAPIRRSTSAPPPNRPSTPRPIFSANRSPDAFLAELTPQNSRRSRSWMVRALF